MIRQDAMEILARRAAVAEENRKAMPQVTQWLDALRRHFPEARVTYAQENGRTRGRRIGDIEVRAGEMVREKSA